MHTGITVIVGNVGTVYHGDDADEALAKYKSYVALSTDGYGRCAYEPVTMLVNGCVQFEHEPEPECTHPTYITRKDEYGDEYPCCTFCHEPLYL